MRTITCDRCRRVIYTEQMNNDTALVKFAADEPELRIVKQSLRFDLCDDCAAAVTAVVLECVRRASHEPGCGVWLFPSQSCSCSPHKDG